MSPPTTSFDALRAELWRTVARPDLPEDELIQTVLEQLGPALGVSRACYNERQEPSGDLVTVAEWCAPGVKPTLGEHIPAVLLRPVENLGEYEVTVDAYVAELPWFLRPIARPALEAIFRLQDLSSVFAMLYRVDGRPEGALTLDLVRAHARPRGWSAEVRPVMADALQIVGLAVARRRAAQARDASELRYRALVDHLAEGVATTDLEERVIFANPRAAEIFGVPPGRLVGRSLRDFLDDDAWALVRGESSRRAVGESSTYELTLRRPDGTTRRVLVSSTPERDPAGRVVGAIGVFRDITERRRAQEEQRALELRMLQAQKLESLGILAGGIAHDFNNILHVVLGNAEVALRESETGSPTAEMLADIIRASNRAADLARQMLAYAGRAPLRSEPFDLSALVDEIAHILTVSVPKKATLQIDCPAGLPAVVGDPAQLQQVVLNLVTNAAEALGDGGGSVSVRTGVRACDAEFLAQCEVAECDPGDRFVFLEVTDDGGGMPPEVRARIFEPFFTTKFVGRGLGLAALLGIIRAHHGAVAVETAPGQGTCVTIVLPAGEAPVAAPGARPVVPQPRPAPGATILFVDDEEDIRELAERALTQAGYRVLLAADGAEAVDVYAEARPDVDCVVLDLTMPRRDGVEALVALRRVDPEVKVVLSSGFDGRELAGRIEGPPVAGFLRKPYSITGLVAAVADAIRG